MPDATLAKPFHRKATPLPAAKSASEAAGASALGGAVGVPLFLERQALGVAAIPLIQRKPDREALDDEQLTAVQAKLVVNQPGDAFEQEADAVAELVRRQAAPEAAPSACGEALSRLRVSDSGSLLSDEIRSRVEPLLGADLSSVRVHTSPAANATAAQLNAKAFTHRNHIWLGRNQSPNDLALLAHESTHVVQQATGWAPASVLYCKPERAEAECEPEATGLMRRHIEQLEKAALPQFQQAVDNVAENGIYQAGLYVLAVWLNVEAAHRAAVPQPATTEASAEEQKAAGPAMRPATAKTGQATATTSAAKAQFQSAPEADLETERAYKQARRRVLTALGTQTFCDQVLLGSVVEPVFEGDLVPFILDQVSLVGWVARDSADLLNLLAAEKIPDSEQWRAVGLLRQHQNPWHFAYMQAAVAARGLTRRFQVFGDAPARALGQLRAAQVRIREMEAGGPAERLGLLQLRPAEGMVRLLQPLTLAEVAREIYGDDKRGSEALRVFNRSTVAGLGTNLWYPPGTDFLVDPGSVVDAYRPFFVAAAVRRGELQAGGTEPYIAAEPEAATAVPGNKVRYTLFWPRSAFMGVRLVWWMEADELAVRERRARDLKPGPRGFLSWAQPSFNLDTSWEITFDTPGTFIIVCAVILDRERGKELYASHSQVVMTLEEKTSFEFSRDLEWGRGNATLLDSLRRRRDKLAPGSDQSKQIDAQIRAIEERIGKAKGAEMIPLKAVYVSKEDQPVSIPLILYYGNDPKYGREDRGYYLKIWDFTLKKAHEDTAYADRPMEALCKLLEGFADHAPYPNGQIRFQITRTPTSILGLTSDLPMVMTYPTDGGMVIDDVLRGLSVASLALGVVAGLAGQAEVAVPAMYVSGLLAGAAATFSLADRIEHGEFEWDLETAMSLMDIAAALLTAGVASTGTVAVRGVGRASLLTRVSRGFGTVQIGIVGGIHLGKIQVAAASGDQKQLADALFRAITDGALFLIIHRAGRTRVQAGGTAQPAEAPLATMAGAAPRRPAIPPATPEPTAITQTGRRFAEPGTRSYHRLLHEGWTAQMMRGEMRVSGPVEPLVGPLPERAPTAQKAYAIYEQHLQRTGNSREVALYRNVDDGSYAVRVGDQLSVRGPVGGNWETVLHYHPNPKNVLTYRMPAPADVDTLSVAALKAGKPITEFVEYPLPDGSRGRAAYSVTPEPYSLSIEYVRPDGTRVQRAFSSVTEYAKTYGERTTYVDPNSREYRWMMEDLREYFSLREGGLTPGESRTMAGTAKESHGAGTGGLEIHTGKTPWYKTRWGKPRALQPREAAPTIAGTGERTGAHFHEFNAAELGGAQLRLRFKDGLLTRVTYVVHPEATSAKALTERSFTKDISTNAPQPTGKSYQRPGMELERGHVAQREAFKGDRDAERAADQWTNVVPMSKDLNRGKGSLWRAAEQRTVNYITPDASGKARYSYVTVTIEPVYTVNPPLTADGTPIPKAFWREVAAPDGKVLERRRYTNY